MDSVIEILIWLIIASLVLFIANTIFFIRTAASIFIAFLIATICVFAFYQSIFGEIVIMITIVVGIIYAVSRAVRDKRDDAHAMKSYQEERNKNEV